MKNIQFCVISDHFLFLHITVKIFYTFHNLQTSEGEKESDQSTQSLDLGFPDDDDEPPQQEGETNYPKVPHRGTVLLLAAIN